MITFPRTCALALGILVALAAAPAARAADYFVSSSLGNDVWSGTLSEPNGGGTDGPKRSLAAARALLETTAGPGDRILLRRGDVWSGVAPALDLSNAAGSPGNPITVGAYGAGELPRLDYTSSSSQAILKLRPGTSHLRFESLHLMTSAAPGNRPLGVQVLGSSNLPVVHHLEFSSLIVEGLQFGFTMYADQARIEHSVLRNNFKVPAAGESGHSQGIWFGASDDIVIRGNRIENNGKPDSVFDHNIYLSEGRGAVVEANLITGTDGLKLRKTSGTRVRRNTFRGLDLTAVSLGGDIEHGAGAASDIVIEHNLIEDTINGIFLTEQSTTGPDDPGIDGVTIRNNIFRNPRTSGTYWAGQKGYLMFRKDYKIKNVVILGNVFWGIANASGERQPIYVQNETVDPINVTIKNNIFHRTAADGALLKVEQPSVFQQLALDNNIYHCAGCVLVAVRKTGAAYTSLAAFRAQHPGEEPNGVAGDPVLAGPPEDLHLSSASALAIDRGANLPGVLDVDYEGRPRPQGAFTDIGPYEFAGGAAPAAPLAPVLLPPH